MPASRNGRVQVRDLEAPEAIRPAPIQSDTFERQPEPAIDHNLSRLSDSLGMFNSALTRVTQTNDAEAKRLEKERQLAEYERWNADKTPGQRLEAAMQGQVPYYNSPLIGAVVQHNVGDILAQNIGAEIDKDIQAGNVELGGKTFDVWSYVKERGRDGADYLAGSSHAIQAYRRRLDAIGLQLNGEHEKFRSAALAAELDRALANQLRQGFETALEDPNGDVVGTLRAIQSEMGPRSRGGSANIPLARTDEVLLHVLDTFAQKDPKSADAVLKVLNAKRIDAATGGELPELAKIERHENRIASIRTHATRALSKAWTQSFEGGVLERNVAAVQSGSLGSIMDIEQTNPYDETKSYKVTAEKQRDEAIRTFVDRNRAALARTIAQPDVIGYDPSIAVEVAEDREMRAIINTGYNHPQYSELLQSAYRGVISSNTGAPDQMATAARGLEMFEKIANRNHAWLTKYVDKDARDYFEGLHALTGTGRPLPEAIAMMGRVNATKEGKTDPNFEAAFRAKIDSETRGIDLKPWWPGGQPTNLGDLKPKISNLAEIIFRAGGGTEERSVELATKYITERGVWLNGRAIVGEPSFVDGDQKFVQPFLDKAWSANSARLTELGLKSGSALSLAPVRDGSGQFYVVAADPAIHPFPILEPVRDDKGTIVGMLPMKVRASDIATMKAEGDKARARAADEAAKKARIPDPMAPHNLIRGLFGADPIR